MQYRVLEMNALKIPWQCRWFWNTEKPVLVSVFYILKYGCEVHSSCLFYSCNFYLICFIGELLWHNFINNLFYWCQKLWMPSLSMSFPFHSYNSFGVLDARAWSGVRLSSILQGQGSVYYLRPSASGTFYYLLSILQSSACGFSTCTRRRSRCILLM